MDLRKKQIEDVFEDYKGRRTALIKSLTEEKHKLFAACDPRKEDLRLYAFGNRNWEVSKPDEDVPADLPEPVFGINICRDDMDFKEWSTFLAVHSDSWLVSVAFFLAYKQKFDKNERAQLFEMINCLPTITETVKKAEDEWQRAHQMGNCGRAQTSKKTVPLRYRQLNLDKKPAVSTTKKDRKEEMSANREDNTTCAICGKIDDVSQKEEESSEEYHTDWICCDVCDVWLHNACVKVSPTAAKHIEKYECPACCKKEE